jgi:ParB family transcriptional regulator, chromosome partitioning protein
MTAELKRGSGLGRGLAALIPQRPEGRSSVEIPIAAITHNPYQPRQQVERAALEQLAQSIGQHGVLQPILVAEAAHGYVLIAGERRLRAAEMAGLERIPALVRTVAEHDHLSFALIENLQRADLNPIEEAHAFRQLVTDFGLSQQEVADRVGRSRPAIANTLRLLDMASAVQQALADGSVSEGHARALGGLSAELQKQALALIIARSLSVRQAEELGRRLSDRRSAEPRTSGKHDLPASPELERIENGLRTALGTKVSVTSGRRGGRITIEYYDDDDLGRLFERLTGGAL